MPLAVPGAAALFAITALAAVAGCQGDSVAGTGWSSGAVRSPAVVAVVNGRSIVEADLAVAMTAAVRAADPHGASPAGEVAPPTRAEVLDRLVDEELAAQHAIELGLDADPELAAELDRRQAELDAFRRQRLAALLARDVRQHATVSDADVRAYFAAHADQVRTVIRVSQILSRDRATIDAAARDLAGGKPFEEVAAAQYPTRPAGARPWELASLTWNQVPEPWLPALDKMAVGDVSPILEGPRGRLWIIKLEERRVDPSVTVDSARPAIEAALAAKAADAAQAELVRSLRARATITRGVSAAGASHVP